ncbi:SLC25A16 isoform 5, partial [Pan troglodytes]
AFEHYKTLITTKLGISGHVHRLMAGSMAGKHILLFVLDCSCKLREEESCYHHYSRYDSSYLYLPS